MPQLSWLNSQYEVLRKAHLEKDLDCACSIFSHDILYLPQGGQPILGIEAFREHLAEFYAECSVRDLAFEIIRFIEVGELAYDVSNYTLELSTENGHEIERGRHVVVWTRTSGSWQICVDMYNLP